MFLTNDKRLFQNLTIQNLDIDTLHGNSLKIGFGDEIEHCRLNSHNLQMCRLFLEQALDTHTNGVLGSHIFSKIFAVLIIILTHQSFENPIDSRADLTFSENFLSFGIAFGHKDTLEDIQFLVSHRAISSGQFAGHVAW